MQAEMPFQVYLRSSAGVGAIPKPELPHYFIDFLLFSKKCLTFRENFSPWVEGNPSGGCTHCEKSSVQVLVGEDRRRGSFSSSPFKQDLVLSYTTYAQSALQSAN